MLLASAPAAVLTAFAGHAVVSQITSPADPGPVGPGRAGGPAGREDGRDATVDLERHITGFVSRFGGNGGYHPPDRAERRTVADGLRLLLDGRREDAARRLAAAGYGVRTLTDRATGRRYAEIADLAEPADGSPAGEDSAGGSPAGRGWGRVYVDLGGGDRAGAEPGGGGPGGDGTARWSVQVPHPAADRGTERLGAAVLRGTPGGVLVVAGAHREAGRGDAADVAHRRDTVFHAVCAELASRGVPGVQLHGFADDSVPGYDAVVSTGRGDDGREEARTLARGLRRNGLEVCRAWARRCELAGRGNEQGKRFAAEGVPFLHVELAHAVRSDGERARRAVGALTEITG
ncbi:hypothetical protein KBZ10_17585 [Streptomyces sp. F63]|uniref:hypothetical protein n=1 Tax=Streptomyces sp. F63 TaxID=2824887 RepID=UPI001B386645|nr:hypothetical protein [Streptomyces sp. F63]MBQ0986292.1 hypothetical protein [Streptomyces sp. F63]